MSKRSPSNRLLKGYTTIPNNMREVAERARVSTATVSRVLSGKSNVDPRLRDQVLRAVRALRYNPNRVARQLRGHPSPVLGLILSDVENAFFISIIKEVEAIAFSNGYSVIVCNSSQSLERERVHLDVLSSQRVAGVIIATTDERRGRVAIAGLSRYGIPVVALDRRVSNMNMDTVILDNTEAAVTATRHLMDDGHQRIGFIGGLHNVSTGRDRWLGFRQAHREAQRSLGRSLITVGDGGFESGRREADKLLALAAPPTAILVANGLMTLGALTAIHARGLVIPDDISIMGFDDLPWATVLDPALSVMAQPVDELARVATNLLLRRIASPTVKPELVVLQPTLVVRDSCGPHSATATSAAFPLTRAFTGVLHPAVETSSAPVRTAAEEVLSR